MKALINCAALVKGGGRLKACVGMGGGREANRSAKKKKSFKYEDRDGLKMDQ